MLFFLSVAHREDQQAGAIQTYHTRIAQSNESAAPQKDGDDGKKDDGGEGGDVRGAGGGGVSSSGGGGGSARAKGSEDAGFRATLGPVGSDDDRFFFSEEEDRCKSRKTGANI